MKNRRFANYLTNRKSTNAMSSTDVSNSPDAKTDQDFPGYPNGQSTEKMITPTTSAEEKTAAVDVKDGDKMTHEENAGAQNKVADTNEALSDGSGGAFEATEKVSD